MSAAANRADEGPGEAPGAPWFVVKFKPWAEDVLIGQMLREQLEVYAPKMPVERTRKGARVVEPGPLFPGYLFVHRPADPPRFNAVYRMHGVQQVFVRDRRPIPVKDAFIQVVRRVEAEKLAAAVRLEQATVACPWTKGDAVRLPGAFGEVVGGIFEERLDANRIAVLTKLLGGDVRTIVDLARVS